MPLNPPTEVLSLKKEIYSVSRLNREAKLFLGQNFSSIQVEGEISNLSKPSSGHLYFTLKDSNAQIRCALFKSRYRRATFKPQNGQQVIVKADVSLFEQRGDYQLIVEAIDAAGDGDLRRQFEQLMQKLSDEGLFDESTKRPLPIFPQTIGVITSPSGAAIQDILAVFRRRAPQIQLNIYPTPVQGAESEKPLLRAIHSADHRSECDLLILARGGGSAEDLSLFNSEKVARAIFKCKTPIVTGIGHEIDFSIADFVADLRAATPSAAAESCCPENEQLSLQITQHKSQLNRRIITLIEQHKQQLNWLIRRLRQQHPKQQLLVKSQRLDELEVRLQRAIRRQLEALQSHLEIKHNHLNHYNPRQKITNLHSHINHLHQKLVAVIRSKTSQKEHQLREAVRTLEAISPLSTLARGYAIVSKSGSQKLLSSVSGIQVGQQIEARLSKGSITCQVKEIHDT